MALKYTFNNVKSILRNDRSKKKLDKISGFGKMIEHFWHSSVGSADNKTSNYN